MEDGYSPLYDIYIVGTGMVGLRQITPESSWALRHCRKIFALHHDLYATDILASQYDNFVSLNDRYQEGKVRAQLYSEVADTVLHEAVESSPVAFLTYGHPGVLVTPTRHIAERAEALSLTVKIMPGISAFDTLFVDLGLDPGRYGLQSYEATDILKRSRSLAVDVPCLIWQIGATGTGTVEAHMTTPQKLRMLTNHLEKFYPPDHDVVVARSATTPLGRRWVRTTTLHNLPGMADHLEIADTLYVPAVQPNQPHSVVGDTAESDTERWLTVDAAPLDRVDRSQETSNIALSPHAG